MNEKKSLNGHDWVISEFAECFDDSTGWDSGKVELIIRKIREDVDLKVLGAIRQQKVKKENDFWDGF